ncbi:MAG: FecR domain-containing protein [Bacteroidota bacterium]|nr:FecR domain-containing protein [Bacteroidota bacterium]MDP3144542.1 FecR domain-containing protein [Bacteroidota bacterium]MDP3555785.1 FecR domain-containing protein [Bacteroidota bacterium]
MDQDSFKLIIKKLSTELSTEEEKEFDSWINAHSDNQILFKQIEKTWNVSGGLYSEYSPDTDEEWKKLKAKIESAKSGAKVLTMPKINTFRIAAAILVVVALGFLLKFMLSNNKVQPNNNFQIAEITTTDTVNIFYLPDSSKIILNKNSSISYAKDFADTARMAYLAGEAYFEISKNGKPFIVYAEGIQVRVMGTSFNVKANEHDDNVCVVVFEGQVAFSEQGATPSSAVKLEADDKINFNKNDKEYKKEKNNENDFWWGKINHKSDSKLEKEAKKVLHKIKRGLRKK